MVAVSIFYIQSICYTWLFVFSELNPQAGLQTGASSIINNMAVLSLVCFVGLRQERLQGCCCCEESLKKHKSAFFLVQTNV